MCDKGIKDKRMTKEELINEISAICNKLNSLADEHEGLSVVLFATIEEQITGTNAREIHGNGVSRNGSRAVRRIMNNFCKDDMAKWLKSIGEEIAVASNIRDKFLSSRELN